MKKNMLRKVAAIFAACTMLTAAVPMNVPVSAAGNIISNSTFENGTSGWGTYKESGGKCSLSTENGRLALKVSNVGQVNYAVQVYYDIVPLYQNAKYRLKYDISCTIDRFVEGMIQQNGGTYQAYTWKGLDLTSTPQTVDYEFTMEKETDIMAKLLFNCGTQGEDLPEHTIYIDNVSLELIDDSQVDYSASRPYEPSINVNQVGYKSNSKKVAVLKNVEGTSQFQVVNADTGSVVYTGDLSAPMQNSNANETNWQADFSSVTAEGNYYIQCGNLDKSYTFHIGENAYGNLLSDSVKMLYRQRCGTAIQDEVFSHPACHNTMATVYGTNQKIDVSGGWHDAGDYGRYIVPAAKTIADLLYAYQENPQAFGDNTGIPESGNGKADILDEARYELEWMLKMQADNGGVYHKVSCATFPSYCMPEEETAELIVTPISSTSTADFCGAMALAYEFYKDVDADFANKCLTAAEKAWSWLESNPNFLFQNPEDIVTGEYGDNSDRDERYWAAAQLYRATQKDNYLSALQSMSVQEGLDWATVGDYGNIAILTMKGIDKNSDVYQKAKSAVIAQADKLMKTSNAQPYQVARSKFDWGSNMTVANCGVVLGMAYKLTGEQNYLNAAEAQLNYLLGVNPLGECFVTGYGTVSPQNPHHRPSMAKGQASPAMLVGGVNSNLEDSAAKAYLADVAPAKCYVDNSESYSTNEICIYWNSPLTYLMTVTDGNTIQDEPVVQPTEPVTEPTEPVTEPTQPVVEPTQPTTPSGNVTYGDVDGDGDVDIIDVLTLNQYLLGVNEEPIHEANADVDNDKVINDTDAMNILKSLVKLTTLPVGGSAPVVQPTEATTEIAQPVSGDDKGTEMNANATMVANFRNGESQYFFASNGWTNGSCFDCWWYKENTSFNDGCLNLTIDGDRANKHMYSGAEYRTVDFYRYGYYETSMQAIKNDGVVSSFFTYTGPSDNNPWDEIDIEILGKDTTKVQFNYYTNGVGQHEYMYDLGFDASQGFHTYGFDWQPDHITWYVDGKAVYTATENIPSTAGKIMMNVWPGTGVDDWLKPFNGNVPLTARYQWVTYQQS